MKKRRKARRRHPGDGKPYGGRTGQGCGGSSVLDRSCVACGARRGSCGAGAWRHRGSWAEIYAWLTRGTGRRKSAGLPGTAHRAGALARGTPLSDFARGWRRRPSPGPPRAAPRRPALHRPGASPTAPARGRPRIPPATAARFPRPPRTACWERKPSPCAEHGGSWSLAESRKSPDPAAFGHLKGGSRKR